MAGSRKDIQLTELKGMISQLNTTIKMLNDTIARQQAENENLKAELAWFRRKLFASSSERRTDDIAGQLCFFEAEPEEEPPAELISPEVVPLPKKSRKKKPTLEEQFKDIPTRQVMADTLTEEEKRCPLCGSEMTAIGTEVIRSEMVYTPPKLERIEYIATTYACPVCKDTEEPQFIKDNGTPALIPGSYVSESLLSHVIYQKYGLYLPLYRQEQDFLQLNAPISRTSMAHWIISASLEYMSPMYDYFHRELLKRRFLMMDETPIQVLKEDGRRPQSKSYFWLIRTGEDGGNPIILYNYTPTRAGENARQFLKGIEPGFYLMADGYQGYNKVKETKRCCCYAHIRRYLLEAIPKGQQKDYSNPAVQGVLYCNKLFEYERSYKEKGLSYKQIGKQRLKDQKPVIEGFLAWVKEVKPGSNGKLKKAITYIKNREDFLMTYLEDGRCSLSNNLSENSIRPVTVGRKNWLFSDTPEGADANSLCLTMVEMAKAYELNLYEYLKFLLEHRPSKDMSDEELENLSPWNENVKARCSNKKEKGACILES
ncbi:IS66 family transposase [Novisyntrophococcus fermenticellae]|uniref:IS66 family transposase n=1 Tax=Novisyntrophococcus fermenticellae TaxID=2068655 RepID=UPI001E295B10|nr:IS66 family transposase [Novisyntrophococcus fermenticellae]